MKNIRWDISRKMHNWYEQQAKVVGWNTQEKKNIIFQRFT